MKLWKVLGVAGVAGVAATGVAVARGERRRRAYEPDDVRARLRERHAEAVGAEAAFGLQEQGGGAVQPVRAGANPQDEEQPATEGRAPGCLKTPWARLRHRAQGRRRNR